VRANHHHHRSTITIAGAIVVSSRCACAGTRSVRATRGTVAVPTLLLGNDHHYASAASEAALRRLSDDREHPQPNTCGATLDVYSSLTGGYWFVRKNRSGVLRISSRA